MTAPRPTDPPAPAELAELAELERVAVRVARAAAALVRDSRPRQLDPTTKSSLTDVVTVMDTRAERLIRDLLARLRPDDGVLGEEGGATPGPSGITWVVDPIDGTTNYLYDLPLYAVSVAAAVGSPPEPGWTPVAGAVVAAAWGVTWSAHRGGGARRQGPGDGPAENVRVGGCTDLSQALLATGFGYRAQLRAHQAEVLTRVLPAVRDIRRLGSAAVDLCLVADGRVDGYYELGLNPWDLAAGWLVVTEAGGVVHGPGEVAGATLASRPGSGARVEANLTVAANPSVTAALLDLLAH